MNRERTAIGRSTVPGGASLATVLAARVQAAAVLSATVSAARMAAARALAAVLAAAVLAALALPSAATATAGKASNAGNEIIRRCTHGQSISGFPTSAYRQALKELPTEIIEYSECPELIQQAEIASARQDAGKPGQQSSTGPGSGKQGPPGKAGGGAPAGEAEGPIGNRTIEASPAEQQAVEAASATGDAAVAIGNRKDGKEPIVPGVVHADLASAAAAIPAPLLAVLAALAALLIALACRTAAGGPLRALKATIANRHPKP